MLLKTGLLRCAAVMLVGGGVACAAGAAESNAIVPAFTAPMDQSRSPMTFRQPGIVRQVLVKKGDHVKKGQVLIQLDDSVEVAQWKSLEIQGKSTLQEEAAKMELAEKKLELERFERMVKSAGGALPAASQMEVDRARLEADTAQKKIEIAREEQIYKSLDAAAKKAQVDQMRIEAPFDGEIEEIGIAPGVLATSDPNKPAVIVVQTDPLNVLMHLPNRQADKLQTGDTMQVRYGESGPWIAATVDFISPNADTKSFTRMVTLMMSNPSGMALGQQVQVKLPQKAVEEERTASAK